MSKYNISQACEMKNNINEEYCLKCGQKEKVANEKLETPKDKIILLDLNYTLISNSWNIRFNKLPQKIYNMKYEHKLVELIKDNYVILITASPYETPFDSLKHIEENTELEIKESYLEL